MDILSLLLMVFVALVAGGMCGFGSATVADRINQPYTRHIFDTLGVGLAVGSAVFAVLMLTYVYVGIEDPKSVAAIVAYAMAAAALFFAVANARNEVEQILHFNNEGWPRLKKDARQERMKHRAQALPHL